MPSQPHITNTYKSLGNVLWYRQLLALNLTCGARSKEYKRICRRLGVRGKEEIGLNAHVVESKE